MIEADSLEMCLVSTWYHVTVGVKEKNNQGTDMSDNHPSESS